MQCPLALFPAKGDVPDAEEILEELKKKPFGDDCSLKRYDDQIHGTQARAPAAHVYSRPTRHRIQSDTLFSRLSAFQALSRPVASGPSPR